MWHDLFSKPARLGSGAVLALLLLSCSGCVYGGYGGGGYGDGGYATYQQYPIYQQPPVQVYGGYYQRDQTVRRAEDRGRQSVRIYRAQPQYHPQGRQPGRPQGTPQRQEQGNHGGGRADQQRH